MRYGIELAFLVERYGFRGKSVKHEFTLLIADRNPNVRILLQREMTAAGYRVRLADTSREVLKLAFQGGPLDLIILDPDLPDADEAQVLEHFLDRIPALR